MRSFLITAAVAASTFGSARPAEAQVYVTGGYTVPQATYVYPASEYTVQQATYVYPASGYSVYSPSIDYGYATSGFLNSGYSNFATPYVANGYNTYRYGGGNFNQGYQYGYGNRFSGVNGYQSSYGAYQGGRRWRR